MKSDSKLLDKLYSRRLASDDVVNVEFAKHLCQAVTDTGCMVGVLVDRRGEVEQVILGKATRLYLPDIGRSRAGASRLRGLRLIVAKPRRSHVMPYGVDADFITDLEKLRLDAVIQIEAMPTALPGRVAVATVSPDGHQIESYRDVSQIPQDFQGIIRNIENELDKIIKKATKEAIIAGERDVAVLVGVYTKSKRDWKPSIDELVELSRTAGVRVVDIVTQHRAKLDPRTVVGAGKLEEICLGALHKGAEVLIFDCDLTPSQMNAITDLTDLKILDRTMLILDIFARRAKSRAGQMQVELAQLKYSLPRLAKKQEGLSRLTGGIGGQGPGETKLEIDRRRVKEKITRLENEIEKLRGQRQLRRQKRNEREVPTIAIVGYTNAGKSTLLNALTGADVYAKNELFATLDPTSRRLKIPTDREVILIDTVGFIRDLPEGLMNAFRATLEELHDADVLVHVFDGSDLQCETHIEVVNGILGDLGVNEPRRLLVMNKMDLMESHIANNVATRLGAIPISARNGEGLRELVEVLSGGFI